MRLILAVHDPEARARLCTALTRRGRHVAGETGDGQAALLLVKKIEPDVVVLEDRLEGVDGLTAARQLLRRGPSLVLLVHPRHLRLAERQYVERAKALLMAQERLTEEEAHAQLRRLSMLSRRTLGDVAPMMLLNGGKPRSVQTPARRDPPDMIFPMIVGKLVGGVTAVALAMVLANRMASDHPALKSA